MFSLDTETREVVLLTNQCDHAYSPRSSPDEQRTAFSLPSTNEIRVVHAEGAYEVTIASLESRFILNWIAHD